MQIVQSSKQEMDEIPGRALLKLMSFVKQLQDERLQELSLNILGLVLQRQNKLTQGFHPQQSDGLVGSSAIAQQLDLLIQNGLHLSNIIPSF